VVLTQARFDTGDRLCEERSDVAIH
jgi:hypothetical protein